MGPARRRLGPAGGGAAGTAARGRRRRGPLGRGRAERRGDTARARVAAGEARAAVKRYRPAPAEQRRRQGAPPALGRPRPASGLVPDPQRMALFTGDPAFQQALECAWSQVCTRDVSGTVLWSVEEAQVPSPRIDGGSAGAAFAVALD